MIDRQLEAEILRLSRVEKWPIGTICTQLGVHHDTVERVLTNAGLTPDQITARPSKMDPFVGFIHHRNA